MSDTTEPSDDDVLALLGEAMNSADEIPQSATETARNLFSWRRHGGTIALELLESQPVRGESEVAVLNFGADGFEVTVSTSAAGAVVDIEPWTDGTVEVEVLDAGTFAIEVEPNGGFAFETPARPWRLRVHIGGSDHVSDWINSG